MPPWLPSSGRRGRGFSQLQLGQFCPSSSPEKWLESLHPLESGSQEGAPALSAAARAASMQTCHATPPGTMQRQVQERGPSSMPAFRPSTPNPLSDTCSRCITMPQGPDPFATDAPAVPAFSEVKPCTTCYPVLTVFPVKLVEKHLFNPVVPKPSLVMVPC